MVKRGKIIEPLRKPGKWQQRPSPESRRPQRSKQGPRQGSKSPNRLPKPWLPPIKSKILLVKKQDIEKPLFTVVIPVRNRHGIRVRNCLRSLQLQTLKKLEIIIADYGSTEENHKKLMDTLEPFDCTVFYYETNDLWSLSVARNIGIRRARAKFIATLDVDCIMEPDVVKTTLDFFRKKKGCLIVNRVCHCPEKLNLDSLKLPRDFNILKQNCKCVRPGIGAYVSAPRSWWFKVRGFDERMKLWGAEDDDIKKRAIRDHKTLLILNNKSKSRVFIYHQWHPRSTPKSASRVWQHRNVRILRADHKISRNTKRWGCV